MCHDARLCRCHRPFLEHLYSPVPPSEEGAQHLARRISASQHGAGAGSGTAARRGRGRARGHPALAARVARRGRCAEAAAPGSPSGRLTATGVEAARRSREESGAAKGEQLPRTGRGAGEAAPRPCSGKVPSSPRAYLSGAQHGRDYLERQSRERSLTRPPKRFARGEMRAKRPARASRPPARGNLRGSAGVGAQLPGAFPSER